jgi:hypothetical protein
MSERRTAVVQVADARGVILVIQVFGMESALTSPICRTHPFLTSAFCAGFPRNLQVAVPLLQRKLFLSNDEHLASATGINRESGHS